MGGTDTSILFDFSSYHRSNHRFAIASNILNLVVTMVAGTATPGSSRLLLLSGSGEPAPLPVSGGPRQTDDARSSRGTVEAASG